MKGNSRQYSVKGIGYSAKSQYLIVQGLKLLTIGLVAFLAVACGGGGGNSDDVAPIAAALVVGQGQDQVSITVRSGSEIVLNGENSDGATFPIRSAVWTQTDTTGIVIQLDKRTDLSRAVRIPTVTTPTTLTFDLELTNTDGDVSMTEVTVNVIPVGDSDRFLEFFRQLPGEYTVVAALLPGTTATSEVSFQISERRLVDYPDRTTGVAGAANQFGVEIGTPRVKNSSWLAGTNADWALMDEGVNAFYHPNLCFSVPKLDIDDINTLFDDSDPDRGIADHRRDDVSQFVELSLTVTGGTCEDDQNNAIDCQDAVELIVLQTNGEIADYETSSSTTKLVAVDVLSASTDFDPLLSLQPESAETAAAYYAAVDPFDRRLTLDDWLENAGFTAGGDFVDDGSTANTLYINNYDLGFTRDMFVRKNDAGDVFAYVTNYPALRKATLGTDVIATVAMEYAAPDADPSAPRIVTFYVFSPDAQGQGEQIRVSSLNFDGRGEKWVPGACVACHGGNLKKLDAMGNYPQHGDIDAAFLPWDLDSFLYVDAEDPDLIDPLVVAGFEVIPQYITPEDLAAFSKENQEPDFREMNELVLTTMKEKPGESPRFELVRQQIHDWYGSTDYDSDDLPDVPYDGRGHIPPGWVAAGQEEVYHEVFARHCRICHSQAIGINTLADIDTMDGTGDPAIRALTERFIYEDGLMPNARLDMDRFWVDFRGNQESPAARLAEALGFDMNDPKFTDGPLLPIARVKGQFLDQGEPRMLTVGEIDSQTAITASNGQVIRLDASISALAKTFAWRLVSSPGSAQLNGADTAKPAFKLDAAGDYVVKVHVGNDALPLPDEATLSDPGPCATNNCATITISSDRLGLQPALPSFDRQIVESLENDITRVWLNSNDLAYLNPDDPGSDGSEINYVFDAPGAGSKGTLSPLTFTQADLDAGNVVYYEHDFRAEGPTDLLSFTVSVTGGDPVMGFFTFNITDRNDEPFNETQGPPPARLDSFQGATSNFSPLDGDDNSQILHWRDFEFPNDPTGITFTPATAPSPGTLTLSGTPLIMGNTFTQADVNDLSASGLAYVASAAEPSTYAFMDSFSYTVSDRDGLTVAAQSLGIDVSNTPDAPQLRTRSLPLEIERGRDLPVTVELASGGFPDADLAVFDPDSPASGITLTLEVEPDFARGCLVIRDIGGADEGCATEVAQTILRQADSFLISEVFGTSRELLYVNIEDPDDEGADTFDSFTFSLIADVIGMCDTDCITNITVQRRTDGPVGPASAAITATSVLADTADDGGAGSPSATPPWYQQTLNETDLPYTDGDGGTEPPTHDITFTLVSQTPPTTTGLIDVSGTTLSTSAPNNTFTRTDLVAGNVTFFNQDMSEGIMTFTFDITDGDDGITIQRELTVTRQFNEQIDLGWVLKTTWPAGTGITGGTCATSGCHSPAATHVFSTPAGAAGAVLCSPNMTNRITNGTLPDRPTLSGHSPGAIFPADDPGTRSWPHFMLQFFSIRDSCNP